MTESVHVPNDEGDGAEVVPTEDRGADFNGVPKDEILKDLEGIEGLGGTPAKPAETPTGATKSAAKGADKPADGEQAEEEESRIASLLKAREKAQKTREDALAEAASIREQAKREAAEDAERYRAEARRKIEEEQEQYRRAYRENPLEAFKRMGVDGQRLVDDVTTDGTPEARARRALQQAQEEQAKELRELREWRQSQEKAAQERSYAEERQRQGQNQDAFMRNHASAEKVPSAHRIWEPEEILAKAIALDQTIRNTDPRSIEDDKVRTLFDLARTNPVAYWDELSHHIEYTAKQRLAKLGHEPDPTPNGAKPAAATKPRAPGSRTPSASSSSERRASPKPLSDMTPDEQRAALAEEAEAIIRAAR